MSYLLADGKKLAVLTAKGPASDTSIASGADANIGLAVQPGIQSNVINVLAIREITGLPGGVVLEGISVVSPTTIRITVRNTTAAAVTVSANSVTATVLAEIL